MRLQLLTFLVISLCSESISTPVTSQTSITTLAPTNEESPSTSPGVQTTGNSHSSTGTNPSTSNQSPGTGSTISTTTTTTTTAMAGTGSTISTTATTTTTAMAGTGSTISTTTTTTTTAMAGTGSTISTTATTTTTQMAGTDSTTTINVPTTTLPVATVAWEIPLNNTDPTELLRAITLLNSQVLSLKADVQALYNNLDINGTNNYITQLQNLNDTITTLENNTKGLEARINSTTAIYSATLTNVQPLLEAVQCFRESECPSVCPGSFLIANSTWQEFSYGSAYDYNCTTTLQTIDGSQIVAWLNLTVTGSANLIVQDSEGHTNSYTTNETNTNLTSSGLSFRYSRVNSKDTISLSVGYYTEDVCKGVNCTGHGNCVVHNGQPTCSCTGCHSGVDCEVPIDPCVGTQVKRTCTSRGGKCDPVESPNTCDWKCICPDGKQIDDKSCSTSVSDSMLMEGVKKWLYWKN